MSGVSHCTYTSGLVVKIHGGLSLMKVLMTFLHDEKNCFVYLQYQVEKHLLMLVRSKCFNSQDDQ